MEVRDLIYQSTFVRRTFTALFLALLWSASDVNAQVEATVDTTLIRIGEEIRYELRVEADSTQLVLFPEGQTFQPLEMIESFEPDTLRTRERFRLLKRYGLTQFDSGSYTIPPQKIVVGDRVFSTDSIRIEVRDVPVDTTTQKMFDIKPPIEVGRAPFSWMRLIWLVPLLLVAAAAYFWWLKKRREAAAQVVLEPLEEALYNLQQLDTSKLLEKRQTKAYYSSLTDILKRYLYREEIDPGAMERTSDELVAQLYLLKDAGKYALSTTSIKELNELLKRADLVKFARQQLPENQAQADRRQIELFVSEAHAAIPEPTEEELRATAAYQERMRLKRKRKRILIGSSAGLFGLVLAALIYGSVAGFDNLRDLVLGNELRDLAEGQWYRSEYGNPSVIVETPEILKRKETPTDSLQQLPNLFTFGSERDPLYVSVYTGPLKQVQGEDAGVNLERLLDQALADLEARGARNMLVKRADFETENGLKGLKAFGEFNVQVSENRVLKNASKYELILFAQPGAVQQILIVYQDDGRFAEPVKERILNSIELELQQQKPATNE
jgi:hypothetical protein